MHQLLAALFAAEFNIQQSLSMGVIGGGAGLIITVVVQLIQKSKSAMEGQSAPKKLHPLVAVLLIAVGLILVVVGTAWRIQLRETIHQ